jgi:hypothetical protein
MLEDLQVGVIFVAPGFGLSGFGIEENRESYSLSLTARSRCGIVTTAGTEFDREARKMGGSRGVLGRRRTVEKRAQDRGVAARSGE